MIEKYFDLSGNHTSVRTEFFAGLTTFVSMAYILFVNPSVLAAAGMDKGAVFTATGLIAAIATIFMGVVAKYPFAIAPGLGINAFFAYTVVLGMGVRWQTALAAVFVSGIIFWLLTVFKIREIIINAIPADLKSAIAGGIGLFIAFLGLSDGGVVAANKSTIIGFGDWTQPTTMLTLFGILLTFALFARKVPGAIFIGLVLTAVAGLVTGLIHGPNSVISAVPSLAPTFGQAIWGIKDLGSLQMVVAILTFLLVAFFDTAGSLVGLARTAGFLKNNELPNAGKALMADSVGMLGGALLGTSPTTAYIESSTGIMVGGRTGLTSVFTGILFLLSLAFSPLLTVVTSQVTAPALVVVGVLMASSLGSIDWSDFPIAAAAFLTILGMPLSYSISDGIALGFIVYPFLMLVSGRGKQVHPIMYALGIIFVFFMIILQIN
ncbi:MULTISPECIES: NCS2 family permease [Leuconostoc]|uniref:NCS2 family permease n=1 Tax=Leuconostoc TaxID=1243 RepID=UPI000D50626B|nr:MULTISPECIES: NCS2 family permease [Leuconostoc]KAA8324779.1 NCS2 family permease [Leuconostoc carnosum]KAA8366428.1 NCS2 family permease [Leuconostoc carnosum]KAA8369717.1 NCS2 family permease [Leuconostoc carnosum]KAA8371811.1 NCS2 family permease [Leuconostoc carnosum]KAA8372282.1 NCS2 family permease [Leuconostoc carnosum]